MKRHFFITGLPRSRTAWLANWLTWGGSFCYHDGFVGCASVDDFASKLRTTPGTHVGNSDPANVCFWQRLVRFFPDASWVIIKRNMDDAMCSSQRAFGSFDEAVLERWAVELDEIKHMTDALVVPFEEINKRAFEIAEHVGVNAGGVPRLRLLANMQVQIVPAQLKQGMADMLRNPPQQLVAEVFQ